MFNTAGKLHTVKVDNGFNFKTLWLNRLPWIRFELKRNLEFTPSKWCAAQQFYHFDCISHLVKRKIDIYINSQRKIVLYLVKCQQQWQNLIRKFSLLPNPIILSCSWDYLSRLFMITNKKVNVLFVSSEALKNEILVLFTFWWLIHCF